MKNIRVTNLGQIKEADINFGDLTLFVGPQATGKSILLQSIKLMLDSPKILGDLEHNGYDIYSDISNIFEIYFGEGMRNIRTAKTQIWMDEQLIDFEERLNVKRNFKKIYYSPYDINETAFFVPAQRVTTIVNGWPRPFSDFDLGDSYVVREFSEKLRSIIQNEFLDIHKNSSIFPNPGNMYKKVYQEIEKSIFHGASVWLKIVGMRKQFYLQVGENSLPITLWSAGQREFIPLLFSFDWLKSIQERVSSELIAIKWVVIEEPEMGLHPQAILSVILMCLDLIHSGYRLIISTHSPVLLEAVWAIRFVQRENSDVKYLYQLFNLEPSELMTALFENILKNKTFSTYYFDQQKDGVYVKDISSLDPGDLDSAIAEWGGLTSFSSRASEVVSQAAQEKA
jgi:predicted ATP-dependent endonuclease of OLD family